MYIYQYTQVSPEQLKIFSKYTIYEIQRNKDLQFKYLRSYKVCLLVTNESDIIVEIDLGKSERYKLNNILLNKQWLKQGIKMKLDL